MRLLAVRADGAALTRRTLIRFRCRGVSWHNGCIANSHTEAKGWRRLIGGDNEVCQDLH